MIWYTPFKYVNSSIGKLELPEVCVFNIKEPIKQCMEYDEKHMISAGI